MTEANWTQLIAMCGAVAIPGIVSCWLGWLSFKKSQSAEANSVLAAQTSQSNSDNIDRLRKAVDGRFTELLSSTAGRAKLEGFLEGGVAEAAKAAASKGDIALMDSNTISAAHALLETAAAAAVKVLATAAKKSKDKYDKENLADTRIPRTSAAAIDDLDPGRRDTGPG